jgi:Ca2+-binding EF-hand superfamily protein
MKALTILGLGLGLGLAVLGGTAVAGPGCDREGKREAMREAAEASFAQADADGSGSLTADEFTSFHEIMRAQMAAHRFERADTNGDGAVTLEELAESHGSRHKRGPAL